jgi:hypothetical protein
VLHWNEIQSLLNSTQQNRTPLVATNRHERLDSCDNGLHSPTTHSTDERFRCIRLPDRNPKRLSYLNAEKLLAIIKGRVHRSCRRSNGPDARHLQCGTKRTQHFAHVNKL